MKTTYLALAALLSVASPLLSQEGPAAPPKIALLVYQQTQPGRAGARQELETSLARAFDRLQAPFSWIELEAVTGPPGALFFDPGKSYDDIEKAGAQLGSIFAAHPELAQKQQAVDELLTNSNTVVALRRDDLGYRSDTLDLAKARFLQIETVRVRPGHECDFVDAQTTLRSALEKSHSDIARLVYQIDQGMATPTFLVVEVLHSLKELDDRIAARASLERTRTEVERVHLEQIARDAYESRQSNVYGIHPEMSHVSKDFAMQDPQFWQVKEGP